VTTNGLDLVERTVELPGGASQFVYAAGDGPPLLWLHGIGGIEPSHPLLAHLTERRTVLAPLAPGFSDLGELAEIDDMHDLAIYYDDLLDALGLDQVMVAGHSFGAMLAAELAAHYPKRIARLVLISPFGLWNDAYPVADLFAHTATQMPALLYADPSKAPATTAGSDGNVDIEGLVALAQSTTTVAKFMWPIPDRGLTRRLRRITAPTLIVFGEADAFVPPRYAEDFVAGIPNASSQVIPGAGHMVPAEAPAAVAAAIGDFLA
jgi:pimeloyl-ACP methyl ester carboxylesterase